MKEIHDPLNKLRWNMFHVCTQPRLMCHKSFMNDTPFDLGPLKLIYKIFNK